MLSDNQMLEHLKSRGLAETAIDYVMHVRSHPPERRVESHDRRNSTVRYASTRMGRVIQMESWTVEGPFVLDCEYGTGGVLEYWDQPKAVPIAGTRRDKRHYRGHYTPDFLVITERDVCVHELKSSADLNNLVKERPEDWVIDSGQYNYKPAADVFASIGIPFVVTPSAERNPLRADNLQLLIRARDFSAEYIDLAQVQRIRKLMAKRQTMRLSALKIELGLNDLTVVLQMIVHSEIHADINRHRLSEPDSVWIATSKEALALIQEAEDRLLPELGATVAVPTAVVVPISEATHVMQCLKELRGEAAPTRSLRTLRRYRKKLREANGNHRALMRKYGNCGNTTPRLTDGHEALIERVIKTKYGTPEATSKHAAYVLYKTECKQFVDRDPSMRRPVQYNTFVVRINCSPKESLEKSRGGRRAANAAAHPTDPGTRGLHPMRPFVRGHIDHYLMDWFVPIAKAGANVFSAKPWLTVLKDEYTGSTLAYSVGFLPPSRRACAKVIRDCVRRHWRLPEFIVVDNGAEFSSVYFESLLAHCHVSKQSRPPEAPKYGAALERSFSTIQQFLLDSLPGNTNNTKRGREVSPTHRGDKHATVSLATLVTVLERYLFGFYNNNAPAEALLAPNVLLAEGMAVFSCSGIATEFNQEFIIASAIEAPRSSYEVDNTRGIRVYNRWYWSPRLLSIKGKYARDVLIEPWDDTVVYVPVGKLWQPCYSSRTTRTADVNSLQRLLDSTKRLEAREALRLLKQHRDDELGVLLRGTYSLLEDDKRNMEDSLQHLPASRNSDESMLPEFSSPPPYKIAFRDSP